MIRLTLHIPMPPSVNKYSGHLGSSHGVVRDWRKRADRHLLAFGPRNLTTICGHMDILLVWDTSLRPRRDVDNPVKPMLDYLVDRKYIEDDRKVNCCVEMWGAAPHGALVEIYHPGDLSNAIHAARS